MLQCQQLKSVTWTACKRAIETYSFLFFALYFKGLNYGLAMSVIVFTVSVLMFCVASSYWSTVYCLLVYYSPPKSGGLQRKGRPQSIVYTCPLNPLIPSPNHPVTTPTTVATTPKPFIPLNLNPVQFESESGDAKSDDIYFDDDIITIFACQVSSVLIFSNSNHKIITLMNYYVFRRIKVSRHAQWCK